MGMRSPRPIHATVRLASTCGQAVTATRPAKPSVVNA